MIGLKKVTNSIDIICIKWLFVLAEISFAVRIILAIRKKIRTIIIVVETSSKDENWLKSIFAVFIISPVVFVMLSILFVLKLLYIII